MKLSEDQVEFWTRVMSGASEIELAAFINHGSDAEQWAASRELNRRLDLLAGGSEFERGDRVMLVATTDEHTDLKPGALGTVSLIDGLGTVHVDWDCGSRLGMVAEAGDVIVKAGGELVVTRTGRVLTDADIEALADEAERGYDVEKLKRGRVLDDLELIGRVRKDGSVRVGSMAKAVRLVEAAAAAGYTFGHRQTVMGVVVTDLDE